jgi:hypothetical protein
LRQVMVIRLDTCQGKCLQGMVRHCPLGQSGAGVNLRKEAIHQFTTKGATEAKCEYAAGVLYRDRSIFNRNRLYG